MRTPVSLAAAMVLSTCALIARASAQCDPLDPSPNFGGSATDYLGSSVALSGDWLFVGERGNADGILNGGSVRVYHRSPAGWEERQVLTASDADEHDFFGASVAVDGACAVVGATSEDQTCDGAPGCGWGSLYVFELSPTGWVETQKLIPTGGAEIQAFGSAVDIDGDTIVAAPDALCLWGNPGSVHVFEKRAQGWVQTARLRGSDTVCGDDFGFRIALSGDTLAVSARRHDGAFVDSGAVYLFERSPSGWTETLKLTPEVVLDQARFGSALDLAGDRMIVGANRENFGAADQGAAYVFERATTGWLQVARIPDPCPTHSNSGFGTSAALGADMALVEGACGFHFFAPVGPAWEGIHGTTTIGFDLFSAVAMSGRTAAVGQRHDETAGPDAGGAWTIEVPGATSFCASGPNSTGRAARISVQGCTGVGGNMMRLVAGPVPLASRGFFAYGMQRTAATFGNGTLCVAAPSYALSAVDASAGELAYDLDFTNPPPGGAITPGSTWYFQATFRDSAAGGAMFDTSDGAEVLFRP